MVSFKNFASRALFCRTPRTQMTRDCVKLARLLFANAYQFLDLICHEHMWPHKEHAFASISKPPELKHCIPAHLLIRFSNKMVPQIILMYTRKFQLVHHFLSNLNFYNPLRSRTLRPTTRGYLGNYNPTCRQIHRFSLYYSSALCLLQANSCSDFQCKNKV